MNTYVKPGTVELESFARRKFHICNFVCSATQIAKIYGAEISVGQNFLPIWILHYTVRLLHETTHTYGLSFSTHIIYTTTNKI